MFCKYILFSAATPRSPQRATGGSTPGRGGAGLASPPRKGRSWTGGSTPEGAGRAGGSAPGRGGAGLSRRRVPAMAAAPELRAALGQRLRDLGIATVTAEHPEVRAASPRASAQRPQRDALAVFVVQKRSGRCAGAGCHVLFLFF